MSKEIKWKSCYFPEKPILSGDIREVNLVVKVIFEWSNKIIDEYDDATDTVISYKSGFIMKVLPNQEFKYRHENTRFIGAAYSNKKD
jgi:hypothetical protein